MASGSTTAMLYALTATPTVASTRPDDDLTKAKAWHLKKGGFTNPWPSFDPMSTLELVVTFWGRRLVGKGNTPDTTPPTVPVHKPRFLPSRQSSDKLRATWLGHACYYVEFPSGLRVLFDPVFEHRCSPLTFFGPQRYTEAPCDISDIPIVDAVVISHNHYDHLSYPSITKISNLHPNAHFFVPLGNKEWFNKCGITKCTELDWWEEVDLTLTPASDNRGKETTVSSTEEPKSPSTNVITARIGSTPCQHMTARGPFDRNATLWSSWTISSGGKSLYFAGDTGYRTVPKASRHDEDDWSEKWSHLPTCPAFKEIGKLRGPFDLGLIPVGAYDPRFIMSPMHASPRDAVEIFRDTKCRQALGMHWGTWVLTEEEVLEPPKKLKEALKHHSMPESGLFDVCDIGESREF
ncbi:uncharacterized protein HMPREF1541_10718 [Cyphellophora europaea CBS 101466]|uniref:Metallo-beta-lactamase domain-containing protein n=1 Tax=Cyphellophora europaea (strain CBS 101466) TaxID=1220924 RepID=W2S7Z4_CYPE1|nr:uncharacterized protein HMPREF1541_10718 [Cyphellophora europaea CBS 101466]ETN44168.1 hypothetical protein HMPREF1541_10718 [Cyphellophora europaea CBS 101466]